MKKNLIVLSTFAALFVMMACGGDNTAAANGSNLEATVESAEELYKKNCKSCHGKEGNKGLAGAADLSTSEMPLETRIKVVTEGKGRMMPYNTLLSKEEIKKVCEYTMGFKK